MKQKMFHLLNQIKQGNICALGYLLDIDLLKIQIIIPIIF